MQHSKSYVFDNQNQLYIEGVALVIPTQYRIFEWPRAETPFDIISVVFFYACTVNCNLCKSTPTQILGNSLFGLIDFVSQQDNCCLTI